MNNIEARKEIVDIAQGMLNGNIHLILGCRAIRSLRHKTDISDDEIFLPFIGIDSQTDHFPLGKVRDLCDSEYLAKIDAEINDFLDFAGEHIKESCKELIEKLS